MDGRKVAQTARASRFMLRGRPSTGHRLAQREASPNSSATKIESSADDDQTCDEHQTVSDHHQLRSLSPWTHRMRPKVQFAEDGQPRPTLEQPPHLYSHLCTTDLSYLLLVFLLQLGVEFVELLGQDSTNTCHRRWSVHPVMCAVDVMGLDVP